MEPMDQGIKDFLEKERESRRRLEEMAEAEAERVPSKALRKARQAFPSGRPGPASCPHCGKPVTPFRKSPGRQKLAVVLWAVVAVAAFALSFVFPRYFMQCLLVSALAGFKGLLEGRVFKTQVLIYKALRDGEGDAQHLHRLSSHL